MVKKWTGADVPDSLPVIFVCSICDETTRRKLQMEKADTRHTTDQMLARILGDVTAIGGGNLICIDCQCTRQNESEEKEGEEEKSQSAAVSGHSKPKVMKNEGTNKMKQEQNKKLYKK